MSPTPSPPPTAPPVGSPPAPPPTPVAPAYPQHHFARAVRLRRLHRHHPGRLLVVPLDHSVSDGPIVPRGTRISDLTGELAAGGADAVVVHKGSLRHIDPAHFAAMSLILHLNASSAHAPDPDAKHLVTEVEDALRLGADAVSVHINMGSLDEATQLRDLGRVSDLCDRWNLPLLVMMYPRGPQIADPCDPELVAHAVTIAADLGADLVKAPYVGSPAAMAEITAACPIPLLCAGGPRRSTHDDVRAFVRSALRGGAAGVAMGRNIFQSGEPRTLAGLVARLVHDTTDEPDTTDGLGHELAGGHRDDRHQAVLA